MAKLTTKSWDEWIAVLEKAGGRQLQHRDGSLSWNDPERDRHSFVQSFIVKRPGGEMVTRVHAHGASRFELEEVAVVIRGRASGRTLRRSRS